MGVPTSEVGYTPAMPRREDDEVHKGHVVALGEEHLQYEGQLTGILLFKCVLIWEIFVAYFIHTESGSLSK